MDLEEKEISWDESGEINKCCTDCKTTKTPLWRGGAAGPKTLCNACGIRFRKKRASPVGLNKGQDRKRDRPQNSSGGAANAVTVNPTAAAGTSTSGASTSAKADGANVNDLKETLKMKLIGLGEEVLLRGQGVPGGMKKQRCQRRRKLGEMGEAAFCLMALSCGFAFA